MRIISLSNSKKMEKYIEYINNAGNPTIKQFIEDWEPVGQTLIDRLLAEKLIFISNNRLFVSA
jgi:hypothetical protein